jgi:hypothetical protein
MTPARRLLAVLLASTLVAACSFDRDEPAAVTVPRMNTTTTTTAPDAVAPPPPEVEPLEPTWWLQVGGPDDESLAAVTSLGAELVAVGSVTGTTTDAWALAATTSGELLATAQDGTEVEDRATAVATDGVTVLTCGTTDGEFGGPTGGETDVWCSPISEEWELGEVRQLGGPGREQVTGLTMAEGVPHGYAAGAAGVTGVAPPGDDDALALQLRTDGTPEWARQFGTIGADAATAVTMSEDGDGVFVGTTDGSLEGPSFGGRDAWISRFDRAGNQRWTTQIGSAGTDGFDAVVPLGEARRGTEQYVAVGSTDGDLDAEGPSAPTGGVDVAVASFGAAGDLEWVTQFGSESDDRATAVAMDGTTVYVAGSTTGEFGDLLDELGPGGGTDGFLAAVDAVSGEVLWVSRFGSEGDDLVSAATATADGLLVLAGTTTGSIGDTESGGGTDGFLVAFPLSASAGSAARDV